MNTRAIIVLTVLLVFGWAGAALAGEVCDKLPTAPGARLIVVDSADQLAEAVGDPEELAADDDAVFATAQPGDFVCIAANLPITTSNTFTNTDLHPATNTAINITIPNITIYGAIVNSTTGARATLTAGTGLTTAIFQVGATAAQMAAMPAVYLAPPFSATGNPNSVAITDPIFDCAGNSGTAIDVLPGANNTVIELNTIGGLTGACSTAGVLVRADRDTNGDQARDDTDGDGVLEDTKGVRIRANVFDARAGDSGPAIWLEENVVGVGDPNVGALEDQPPFEQCTGAGPGTDHTVIGSSSANAGFATTTPFGPVVGNGPGADDGNLITSTTGTANNDWEDGIRSEGSHICIRGNVIRTISGAAQPAIDDNGIQLDPGANGTAVWGNIIGSLDATRRAVGGDGIAVLGPFKLTSVTPDGDSLYDNIVGNVGSATQAALRGAARNGFLCADERIYVQGSSQGAQRAVDNGDEGFDMSGTAPADSEGLGCTKRDAVFNNDAIGNGGNGFEGGSDFVDNDALVNMGHGFLVPGPGPNRFCGNVANDNGDSSLNPFITGLSGFAVDSSNMFTDGGTFGSATCARGGNTANANLFAGFFLGISPPSLNATGNQLTRTAPPGLPFSTVHQANCNGVIGVFVDGNNNWIAHVDAFSNGSRAPAGVGGAGITLEVGAYGNRLTQNRAGSLNYNATPPATCPVAGTATGTVTAPVQAFGLGVQGGNGPGAPAGATANVAWLNIFGDPDYNSDADIDGDDDSAAGPGTGGSSVRTPGPLEGNHYGIALGTNTAAVLRLEEQDGGSGLGTPQDLDGDGIVGMACNRIVGNNDSFAGMPTPPRGGVIAPIAIAANLQLWADADGAGGTRLSNIWEGNGVFTGTSATTVPSDLANGSTATGAAGILNFEGAWTLVTIGPTPDIFVDPGLNTVQVSSPRNGGATTVDGLFANCAGDSGASPPTPPTPGPSNILGDVNGNSSFEQADLDELLNALRNRASWLTDPTNPKFKVSDVARPCGRITRADYNRLRSSLLRVQKGRSALKSQCGSKGTIGFDPASAPRLLTVLSGQAGAAGVRVAVYDFAGRLLLEQKATGAQVALDLVQRELANGVYLAVVESLAADGRTLVREVRKVIVLR
jgi:hypothetical protein